MTFASTWDDEPTIDLPVMTMAEMVASDDEKTLEQCARCLREKSKCRCPKEGKRR